MIDELMQRENYVMAKKLLDAAHAKHQAYASNIANVETPGYKRQDISTSFEAQLRRVAKADDIKGIQALQPQRITDLQSPNVRPDGNNVQLDQELLRMQENAVHYEFLTNYTANSLSRLKTAISGKL